MNSNAIKAFAISEFYKDQEDEDKWISFDDNWNINIYVTDWDEGFATIAVYPVIDKQVDTTHSVFFHRFKI